MLTLAVPPRALPDAAAVGRLASQGVDGILVRNADDSGDPRVGAQAAAVSQWVPEVRATAGRSFDVILGARAGDWVPIQQANDLGVDLQFGGPGRPQQGRGVPEGDRERVARGWGGPRRRRPLAHRRHPRSVLGLGGGVAAAHGAATGAGEFRQRSAPAGHAGDRGGHRAGSRNRQRVAGRPVRHRGPASRGSRARRRSRRARDRFDPAHPLYRWIGRLDALQHDHPALGTGLQIDRPAEADSVDPIGFPEVGTFSRIDRATGTEYLVV